MQKTEIEYLTHTWNPIAMRCTKVSDGCQKCWHLNMANRMGGMKHWPDNRAASYRGDNQPMLIEKELSAPSKLQTPSRIGVQFMGDIAYECDSDVENFAAVWSVMRNVPWHTFMLLTKRPKRLKELIELEGDVLPNVWLGVTAENQKWAEERNDVLRQIGCAKTYLSVEPMIGPVVKSEKFYPETTDWIIAGPETGLGARPCKEEWLMDLRDTCKDAGIPFFLKRHADGSKSEPELQELPI